MRLPLRASLAANIHAILGCAVVDVSSKLILLAAGLLDLTARSSRSSMRLQRSRSRWEVRSTRSVSRMALRIRAGGTEYGRIAKVHSALDVGCRNQGGNPGPMPRLVSH